MGATGEGGEESNFLCPSQPICIFEGILCVCVTWDHKGCMQNTEIVLSTRSALMTVSGNFLTLPLIIHYITHPTRRLSNYLKTKQPKTGVTKIQKNHKTQNVESKSIAGSNRKSENYSSFLQLTYN